MHGSAAPRRLFLDLNAVACELLTRPEIGSEQMELARRAGELVGAILGHEGCGPSSGPGNPAREINAEYVVGITNEVFDAAFAIVEGGGAGENNAILRAAAEEVAPEIFDQLSRGFEQLKSAVDAAYGAPGEFI